jgi:hypothetical protein
MTRAAHYTYAINADIRVTVPGWNAEDDYAAEWTFVPAVVLFRTNRTNFMKSKAWKVP